MVHWMRIARSREPVWWIRNVVLINAWPISRCPCSELKKKNASTYRKIYNKTSDLSLPCTTFKQEWKCAFHTKWCILQRPPCVFHCFQPIWMEVIRPTLSSPLPSCLSFAIRCQTLHFSLPFFTQFILNSPLFISPPKHMYEESWHVRAVNSVLSCCHFWYEYLVWLVRGIYLVNKASMKEPYQHWS